MVIIKDVTFLSCWGYRIFTQLPHSACATHVFSHPTLGRDSLQTCSTPDLLAPWESPCKLLKKLPLLHDPRSLRKLLCVSAPGFTALKLFKHAVSSIDSSKMASDDSSSSGVSAETRIGSLEVAMGRLRIKPDDNDKKLDAVSKAGEKSWDLLNNELRQLCADLTGNLNEFKDETRTNFKDEANTHGDFGNRISALEIEVAKLKSKIEK